MLDTACQYSLCSIFWRACQKKTCTHQFEPTVHRRIKYRRRTPVPTWRRSQGQAQNCRESLSLPAPVVIYITPVHSNFYWKSVCAGWFSFKRNSLHLKSEIQIFTLTCSSADQYRLFWCEWLSVGYQLQRCLPSFKCNGSRWHSVWGAKQIYSKNSTAMSLSRIMTGLLNII